jgi:hypothetical protein
MPVSMSEGTGIAEVAAIEAIRAKSESGDGAQKIPSEYVHKCKATTKVPLHVALTFAADSEFYSELYCAGKDPGETPGCPGGYFDPSEFTWTVPPPQNGTGYGIPAKARV